MFVFMIKSIRLSKNITLYQLSKMTGLSRTYIRNLENNKSLNPNLATLYKIANALEVNIKNLYFTTFDIDSLKEKMYEQIAEFGINSKEVLETSQLIDLLINIKMNEELDN